MFSGAEFRAIRELVQQRAGIALSDDKRYLVEARLRDVQQRFGAKSAQELLAMVRRSRVEVIDAIVEALTTNETLFFRDVRPFEALKEVVIPELIERRRSERRLVIWCAAASTGQEPYSIAMLIREHFAELLQWKLRILATDISPRVLRVAKEGLYTQLEVNRGLPAHLLVKYFRKEQSRWRLVEEVRRMVEFKLLNLVGYWPPMPPTDVVFLRNVLIYFDVPTKRRILQRVRSILRPDGYLFLGSAETTLHLDDQFEPLPVPRSCCYRPKSKAPAQVSGRQVANSTKTTDSTASRTS